MKDIFKSDFFKPKYFRRHIRDFFIILIGSTLVSLAVKYILDPAGLDTGGISGLAIVVKSISGRYWGHAIPLWVSNLVFNIPIFLFALKVDGIKSIIRTGIGFAIMTIELAVFPEYSLISDNLLLTSLYGGVLFGLGTGIILLARATTGGTDGDSGLYGYLGRMENVMVQLRRLCARGCNPLLDLLPENTGEQEP